MFDVQDPLEFRFVLTKRITDLLNSGETIVADIPMSGNRRCFVRIRPVPNPAVPREAYRYLNSRWSMWEYWWYDFRRMELRAGWEDLQNDYDRFITADERTVTKSEVEFDVALRRWVPPSVGFSHVSESACPE